jgi:hypothetical protein
MINSWLQELHDAPASEVLPYQTDPDVLIVHISPGSASTIIYTPDGGIKLPNSALMEIHEMNVPIGYTEKVQGLPVAMVRQYIDADGGSWHQIVQFIQTTYKLVPLTPFSIRPRLRAGPGSITPAPMSYPLDRMRYHRSVSQRSQRSTVIDQPVERPTVIDQPDQRPTVIDQRPTVIDQRPTVIGRPTWHHWTSNDVQSKNHHSRWWNDDVELQ